MPMLPWETDPSISEDDKHAFYRLAGLYYYGAWSRLLECYEAEAQRLLAHRAMAPELLRMKGYALVQLGEPASALRALAEALRLDPDLKQARESLERIEKQADELLDDHRKRGQWKALEELARAYLAAFPGTERSLPARWMLAVSLDEQGQSREAEPLLRALVDESPLDSHYWHSLAIVLTHLKRRSEATQVCREAIEHFDACGRDASSLTRYLQRLEEHGAEESDERPSGGSSLH